MKPFALTKGDAVRRNAASHDRGRLDGRGWESRRASRVFCHAEISSRSMLEGRSDDAAKFLIACCAFAPRAQTVLRRCRIDLDSIDDASRPIWLVAFLLTILG